MVRLFAAINVPAAMREAIWNATASLRAADLPIRWVKRDLIHMTLKFLGEVDPPRVGEIADALTAAVASTRRFMLPVGGVSAVPRRQPRLVWVECEGIPALELLQHAVEQGMAGIGFPIDGRPFRPHLTIGRAKRHAERSALSGLQSLLERVQFSGTADVGWVDLMESQLVRGGPVYERRARVELRS